MNKEKVICVNNLSKIYKLYEKPHDRVKEAFYPWGKVYHKDFYALNGINFEIDKGDSVGIIGKNGSGKSTLLKIINGVLSPTHGNLTVKGKISALLELGAGFNPEYTGLENVYLQGTIMGFTKKQMNNRINDIVSFAEIGEFINQPVKTYSSGMFVRLAFAVAINVEPEILIVDEALAVGDIFFQIKCYNKFTELKNRGTTILFVSHDISSIKQYCNNVIWLENGLIKRIGDTKEICNEYMNNQILERNNSIADENLKKILEKDKYEGFVSINSIRKKYPLLKAKETEIGGTKEAKIISFVILDQNNNITNVIEVEKEYRFIMITEFLAQINNALFGYVIENQKGMALYGANNYMNDSVLPVAEKGEIYEVSFSFKLPKLIKGNYLISTAIATGTQEEHKTIAWYHHILEIEIVNTGYNQALIELDNKIEIARVEKNSIELV